ncbi:DUF58 domain-containing protein [Aliamphritea spongicola]|uniref:DUF58 domain-containing protein n=1 Tax=Aliamphritea spongicola TaxID=707589 RepID=UPI00196B7F28|nr:DUF58 domain-containing protein [Aliamphritea spongicola]MBN3564260.1 DUF58 domain-containing protein [Aliamphritea spongicola]
MLARFSLAERLARRMRRWAISRHPSGHHIELTQRVIYIFPTRAGFAYLGVNLLILLLAINYQNNLAYAVCFMLGAVFLVSILHTYACLSGVVIETGRCDPVFVGEDIGFTYQLQAADRRVNQITLAIHDADLRSVAIEAGETVRLTLFRQAQQRGWDEAGALYVESRYPLGLFRAWSWASLQNRCLVYPKPLQAKLPPPLSPAAAEGGRPVGSRLSGTDAFQGLDDYQPGDSMSRIAWKKLASGQGLKVRSYTAEQGQEFWLDASVWPGSQEVKLSEMTWQALQYHAQDQTYGVRLGGTEISPDRGRSHLDTVLKQLALSPGAAGTSGSGEP